MKKIISYFIKNSLFSWLAIAFILLAGILAITNLRRDSFPNVDIKRVIISTTFPGASPEDVELRITYPLEEQLKEIDGIDEIKSVSRNSVSDIDVRVDLDDPDPDKVVADIRRAVDSVQNFPPQVTDRPRIIERKSGSFPIYEFSVYGGKDENQLQEYAVFVEEELEKLPGVARVDIFGRRDHEWHVLADFKDSTSKAITIMDLVNSIGGRSINLPAGSLENENSKDIRIDGEFKEIDEIERLPVKTSELLEHVRIGQIAKLRDTYSIPKFLAISNGKPGLILSVVKKERADAIQTVDRVKKKLDELSLKKSEEINFFELNSEAARTKNRLNVVINNAIIGFVIVFLILFLFLNFKTAILTSISLPLSLLMTFSILPTLDISFNLISMMGIIIGLGMLVDNSIVISENIYTYIREGMKPLDAAIRGSSEMVIPIFGSYLTTVAAFVPMLSMSGIMGKFIYQIPLIVIIALSASLIESFLLLPARLYIFSTEKDLTRKRSGFRIFFDRLLEWHDTMFSKLITGLLKRPGLSFLMIVAILVSALYAMSKMKFILFPKENVEIFVIKAEFNPSLRASDTREKMKPIESIIQSIPRDELVSYSIKIGVQQTEANDPLSRYGEQLAIVTVFLTPEVERNRTARNIIDSIEEDIKKTEGLKSLYIEELITGPPIGAALTLSILGSDYEILKKISAEVQDYLRTIPGVINIRDDYNMGRRQLLVTLDHNLEILTGVNTLYASEVVRSAYDGNRVSAIRKGKDKIYIRVMYDDEFRSLQEKLGEIPIRNRYGAITRLDSISKIIEKDSPEYLTHRNFERTIVVNADVDLRKITSNEANALVSSKFSKYISEKYPGYSLLFGGEEKDSEKSIASLARAGMIALFGIFAILALTMNNVLKPIAILTSIPLGIIGIVIGFPLSGKAISFIAMIGIIGLAGVLVNASIVLVDCIDTLKVSPGSDYNQILIEASRRRFRPILLTTLTTMGGLLPTAYSVGGSDPVLIPMTLALGWGLGFGTFGSLIYIPVLFSFLHNTKSKFNQVLHRNR
ncbi:MAG: efflux RND transporter permease subunit [Leptospiraceae bacterium]|nr:efflux RND transporter permease subunit [Leptospiraceae bacterium]MCP5510556.1 efflux RND transporter permease subunit [Leptospiraceae bacterium]